MDWAGFSRASRKALASSSAVGQRILAFDLLVFISCLLCPVSEGIVLLCTTAHRKQGLFSKLCNRASYQVNLPGLHFLVADLHIRGYNGVMARKDQVMDEIKRKLDMGVPRGRIAADLGIHRNTLRLWLKEKPALTLVTAMPSDRGKEH